MIYKNQLRAAANALKEKSQPKTEQVFDAKTFATIQAINISKNIGEKVTDNWKNIQEELLKERLAQGLTQREVATKASMSQATVTRAERHMQISLSCLMRIAAALNKKITLK